MCTGWRWRSLRVWVWMLWEYRGDGCDIVGTGLKSHPRAHLYPETSTQASNKYFWWCHWLTALLLVMKSPDFQSSCFSVSFICQSVEHSEAEAIQWGWVQLLSSLFLLQLPHCLRWQPMTNYEWWCSMKSWDVFCTADVGESGTRVTPFETYCHVA